MHLPAARIFTHILESRVKCASIFATEQSKTILELFQRITSKKACFIYVHMLACDLEMPAAWI